MVGVHLVQRFYVNTILMSAAVIEYLCVGAL